MISYNDTPVKEVLANGISVITIDFEEMGARAGEFLINRQETRIVLPTKFISRKTP